MLNFTFDPPSGEIRSRATQGLAATGLAQMVRLAVQTTSVIVLSRLLTPADFGIIAVTVPIFTLVALLQDLGLSEATVQKGSLTQNEISSAFWVNLGVSLLCAVLLLVIAPLLGRFYSDDRVEAVTAAISILVLISGAGTQHLALLNRRMRFWALAAIDITATVGGFMATLAFALINPTYWAIYTGIFIASLISLFGSWSLARWHPLSPWRSTYTNAMISFGANITGASIAAYLVRNLDNILIGRVWGVEQLGFYDRAYRFLLLPLQQVNKPLGKVMIPTLSRLNRTPEHYRTAFLAAVTLLMLLTLPGVAFIVGAADPLITVLLGPKWEASTSILIALGFAAFLQPLNSSSSWLFISQGRTAELLLSGTLSAIGCSIAFLLGLSYGPIGIAIAYSASECLRTPVLWWYVTRLGPVSFREMTGVFVPHSLSTIMSLVTVYMIVSQMNLPVWPKIITSLVLSYLASAVVLMLFPSRRRIIYRSITIGRELVTGHRGAD